MNRTILFSALVCILLASCGGQTETRAPVVPSSFTPVPGPTATAKPTKTPRPAVPPLPTLTPLPSYPTKQVFVEYYLRGDHSSYDFFFEDTPSWAKLVLYADGQMIIPGRIYLQKMLSPSEIEQFLSELKSLGFYSLESNQKHDETDRLYDYGDDFQNCYDCRSYCLLVNADESRELCVCEPGIPYLIPEMRNILQYVDDYEPIGLTIYYPDRLLLLVEAGSDPSGEDLPAAIPWPDHLPPLPIFDSVRYVDGDAAKEIYMLFENTQTHKVFIQNGKEYTVSFLIVLPHEKLKNANR